MKGFATVKRPRDLFMIFVIFALFSVSLYTSVLVVFFESDKRIVLSTDYRPQRRWQELTHLQSLITDLHGELSEALAERDGLENQLKEIGGSQVVRPIRNRVSSRLRNGPLLGCSHIDAIRIVSTVAVGSAKVVQRGLFGAKEVLVKSVKSNGQMVRNCGERMSVAECVMLGRYRLLREISMLIDLRNENVVEIIGRCVRASDDSSDVNSQNVLLATEYGKSVSIDQLQLLPLKQRLELSANLLNLLSFLSRSPIGSVRIEPFDLTQFRMIGDRLKLTHVDSVTSSEPSCQIDNDCIISSLVSWQSACHNFVCTGYNLLSNLKGAYSNMLTPLLLVNQELNKEQSREITNLLNSLLSERNMSLSFVSNSLRNIYLVEEQKEREEDEAADRMSLFNDLNTTNYQQKEAARIEKARNQDTNKKEETSDINDGYNEIIDVDFPGMYDYNCRRTRAKWGCVLAVNGLPDAKHKCDRDAICKAFVMVPHHSRTGWSVAFLKNGTTGYVRHEGTNVYIKQDGVASRMYTGNRSISSQRNDVFALKETRSKDAVGNVTRFGATSCDIDDIMRSQLKVRIEREYRLMQDLGWPGMTDTSWITLLRTGIVNVADQSKVPDDSNGGNVLVTVSGDHIEKAWFKVEPGTYSKRRHIAHVAFFYLDRLLGMYQTVPTTGRVFSLQEMQHGHFSSIQSEVKRRFSTLLNHDGTLGGSMSAWVEQEVSVKTKLSVSPNLELAWAISPLTQQQKNDLEYLIVMWFGRLNQTPDQFLSTNGRMVHLDGQLALQQSAVEVLPYFNVCQFPRHLVELLKYLEKHEENGCKLSKQLSNMLQSDPLRLLPDDFEKQSADSSLSKLDEDVDMFLNVVEKCVSRFGESIALYD